VVMHMKAKVFWDMDRVALLICTKAAEECTVSFLRMHILTNIPRIVH
jgi:hypothetical protein